MNEDEQATLSTAKAYRAIFAHIAVHEGPVVDAPGDAPAGNEKKALR